MLLDSIILVSVDMDQLRRHGMDQSVIDGQSGIGNQKRSSQMIFRNEPLNMHSHGGQLSYSDDHNADESDSNARQGLEIPSEPLLETWTPFLERIYPSPSFESNTSTTGYIINHISSIIAGSNRMQLIYESKTAGGKTVTSRVPLSFPYPIPYRVIGPSFSHSLSFDSDFESGNLYAAIQRGDYEYDLFLRPDIHTTGHTQW